MHMNLKTFLFFITRIPFSYSTVFENIPFISVVFLFPPIYLGLLSFVFCSLFFVHTHQGFGLLLVLSLVGAYTFQHVKFGAFMGWQIFSVILSPASGWSRRVTCGEHYFHLTYHILCIYPFHLLNVFFINCIAIWSFCSIMAFGLF